MNAIVTTHEAVIFQLLGDKNHEQFKAIQSVIKDVNNDTGLL